MTRAADAINDSLPDWAVARFRAYQSPAYRNGRDITRLALLRLARKRVDQHPDRALRTRLRSALLVPDAEEQGARAAGLVIVCELLYGPDSPGEEERQTKATRAAKREAERLERMVSDAERTLEGIAWWTRHHGALGSRRHGDDGIDYGQTARHMSLMITLWRIEAEWQRRLCPRSPANRPPRTLNTATARKVLRACGISDRDALKFLRADVTGTAVVRSLGRDRK